MATPASAATLPRLPIGAFTFALPVLPQGSAAPKGPARWDPCTTIRWHLDPAGAPPDALAQATEAVRRLRLATGLPLVYDHQAATSQLRISFVPAAATGGDIGLGSWHGEVVGTHDPRWRIESASVVIDSARAAHLRPGFGPGPDLGMVLMHELGHAVGLGHSSDPANIMYPHPTTHVAVWGPGDLAGLKAVGAAGGCLPTS